MLICLGGQDRKEILTETENKRWSKMTGEEFWNPDKDKTLTLWYILKSLFKTRLIGADHWLQSVSECVFSSHMFLRNWFQAIRESQDLPRSLLQPWRQVYAVNKHRVSRWLSLLGSQLSAQCFHIHYHVLLLRQPREVVISISIFHIKNFRSEIICSLIYKHSLKCTAIGIKTKQ